MTALPNLGIMVAQGNNTAENTKNVMTFISNNCQLRNLARKDVTLMIFSLNRDEILGKKLNYPGAVRYGLFTQKQLTLTAMDEITKIDPNFFK